MSFCTEIRFLGIALRFESLVDARGLMPWSPLELDSWSCEFGRNPQSIHAARFVLNLWNAGCQWDCGRFDPREALKVWDLRHRRAFMELITENMAYSA
ncbi:MAG: hypothetical protein J0M26_20370 [Planctomycetes bacterium]|nr:hypothetical protein [Planctomycetota bacterium]